MTQDKRILRTQKLLGDALIAEAQEKGYRNITIQDVTKRADIGYRTYFRHYNGLDELLVSIAQDKLDDLFKILNLSQMGELAANPEQYFLQIGHTLFQHVEDNQVNIRFLLLDEGMGFVFDPVMKRATQRLEDFLSKLPQENIPASLAASHIISSAFSLISWWLENDLTPSSQEMGEIFFELVTKPIWQVMTPGRKKPENNK
ncbi:MAG: TetR/AcrR family transcriptional regulator [Anaerolineales bacterium]|nr:TetR/AcrR family transcriptional regulator [Anaerolineales bacterium]